MYTVAHNRLPPTLGLNWGTHMGHVIYQFEVVCMHTLQTSVFIHMPVCLCVNTVCAECVCVRGCIIIIMQTGSIIIPLKL